MVASTMAPMATMAIIIATSPSTIITTASPSSLVAASASTGNDTDVASHVSGQNTTRGQAGGVEYKNRDATHRV
jgi:hypothetical protein